MTHPKSVAASVIIPVYNGASYIMQQLDALAVQTGNPSFEVLVCDNGSTDDTRAVVESYNASYPLRVVDASQRAGASHARNMGAVQAMGDVLIFCDGDDLVEPDWVASHLYVQNLYSPVIASGSLLHDRANTREVLRAYGLEPGDDQKVLNTRTRILYNDELTPYAGFLPTVAGGIFQFLVAYILMLGAWILRIRVLKRPILPGACSLRAYQRRSHTDRCCIIFCGINPNAFFTSSAPTKNTRCCCGCTIDSMGCAAPARKHLSWRFCGRFLNS